MRATITMILASVFLTGCSTYRDIQICPQACRPVVDDSSGGPYGSVSQAWMDYDKRLKDQKIYYWLTDSAGHPVTMYRYKSDMSISDWLFSQYWPIVPTKNEPNQIAEMVTLKRRTTDAVFHFVYPDGHVDSVDLRNATLEKHKDYEVLYIK